MQILKHSESPAVVLTKQRVASFAGSSGKLGFHHGFEGKAGLIYGQIEHRLATGYYRFGQEILNSDLVKEFKASRAPVTMALNLLRAAGYLIIRPQVGVWVVSPTDEEIRCFFRSFARAESLHTSIAAERATPQAIEVLETIQSTIEETPHYYQGVRNPDQIILAGLFLEQIRFMSGMPWLSRQTASVWLMSNFLLSNRTEGDSLEMSESKNLKRWVIIDCLKTKNSEAAASHMEEYVLGCCNIL